jgi:hypothetical protein
MFAFQRRLNVKKTGLAQFQIALELYKILSEFFVAKSLFSIMAGKIVKV